MPPPPKDPPEGDSLTAAEDLACLLACDSIRGLEADERALLRGLRLPRRSDVDAALDAAAAAATAAGREGSHPPPASDEELALMLAVAAAAGQSHGVDVYATCAAARLWHAVRNGEDGVYAAITLPAPPAPPAPPQLAPSRPYGAEEDGQAACAARAAAAARRALVAVHDAISEIPSDLWHANAVEWTARLAVAVAVGEGGRVRRLGQRVRECGAPVMPGFRLAAGELASLTRALLTVPSLVSRRMPSDDAEFYLRAVLAARLQVQRTGRREQLRQSMYLGARCTAIEAQRGVQALAMRAAIHAGSVASDLVHAVSAELRHGDEEEQGIEGEGGKGDGSLPDAVEDVLMMLVSSSVACCTTQDPADPGCPVVSAFAQVGAASNASAWAGEAAARLALPLRNGATVLALSGRLTNALIDGSAAALALVDPVPDGVLLGADACGTLCATFNWRDGGGRGGDGGTHALCTLALGAFAQQADQLARSHFTEAKASILDTLRKSMPKSARHAARYYERWPSAPARLAPPLREWLAHLLAAAARQMLEQAGVWTVLLDTPSMLRRALSARECARLVEAANSARAAPDVWRAADARLSAAVRGGADEAPGAAGAGDLTNGCVKDGPADMAARFEYSERALDLARLATAVAKPGVESARVANSACARAVAACEVVTARLLLADAAALAQACNRLGIVPLGARRDRLVARRCMSDLAPAAPMLERHLATLEGAATAEFERRARPFLDLARDYEALSLAPLSLSPSPSTLPSRGPPAPPRPISLDRVTFAYLALGSGSAADVLSLALLNVGGPSGAAGSSHAERAQRRAGKVICALGRCASHGAAPESERTKKKCAGCLVARYCGADCQKAAWRWHRYMCPVLKKAREAAAASGAASSPA